MDLTEDDVAAIYDVTDPWRAEPGTSDALYTEFAMSAQSVLDVGCGTGQMLHCLRDNGYTGRLAGIDPDAASLRRAQRRADIAVEWVEGTAADIPWKQEFEVATMANNAFQCLIEDDEVRASLTAIRGALTDGGRFLFETRHPQARAWEDWAAAEPRRLDFAGRVLVMSWEIESAVDGVVTMIETTSQEDGTVLHVGRDRLRFLDLPTLNAWLEDAGFVVEEQYGDFRRGPITSDSRSIVTIARTA
ncbi:class I SAM-dependent methyltransferase [Allokutzneria oryzae]|uniref:Class I SAM-dependent methyltransferase n=1 Tax=Allokutzneria oryzae TaxID=1378989 RepID=A0ABV6A4Y4_9PSEU